LARNCRYLVGTVLYLGLARKNACALAEGLACFFSKKYLKSIHQQQSLKRYINKKDENGRYEVGYGRK